MKAGDPDFTLTLADLGEIVGDLEAEPKFGAGSEGFGEADRHFGGDGGLAVDDVVQSLAGNTESGGGGGHGQAEGFETVMADDAARMGGKFHGHWGLLSFMV